MTYRLLPLLRPIVIVLYSTTFPIVSICGRLTRFVILFSLPFSPTHTYTYLLTATAREININTYIYIDAA